MKKLLVFLLICLSSTVMFAQTPTAYWADSVVVAPGNDGNYMTFNAVIVIDGVEQFNDNLELALFETVGGVCRGTKFPPRTLPNNRRYYSVSTYGQQNEEYTFKVYDHENGMVLPLEVVWLDTWQQPVYNTNGYGVLRNPFIANFVTVSSGIEKDIAAYEGDNDRWYLISSPVGEVDPANVTNMLSNNYDLYYFDQEESEGLEWVNRKVDETEINDFNLELGKGYLYANDCGANDTVTLTFPGEAHTEDVTVNLVKVDGVYWSGWNLIGNPFNEQVSMGDRPFYVMNAEGTDVAVANRNYLEPMEGAFVIAATHNEELLLSIDPNSGGGSGGGMEPDLVLSLGHGRSVIDRAIVRFGGNSTLPKFQLNPNHTKVYIPQEGKDYAVVSADEMGEMPVSFKAEKNGTYSLTFSGENVSFAYLHLIDNLTGNDVDLLATPVYTFDARNTDYASRFKLVFATSDSDDENFAFFNNGNLIINNDGEATLQVVDVMGRILSSETVSGNCSKHINAAKGVYMIRLINGNDVKVQKIVVE